LGNTESTARLLADDCVIYRKTENNKGTEKLQRDLNRLGEWAVENAMEINPAKSKAVTFTSVRVKEKLNCSLRDMAIPEASSYKCLGIILRSDLSRADQVNYTVKKAWKALHFTVRILKNGNSDTTSLAHTSLVRPILSYGAACRHPYREGQINASDRVQPKLLNLHITGTLRTGNHWHSVETQHALCCLHSAHGRTGLESYRGQVTKCMLPERGRS
jgi:hypothetical protein